MFKKLSLENLLDLNLKEFQLDMKMESVAQISDNISLEKRRKSRNVFDMKMEIVGRRSDKIVLEKRRKFRNVKLKVGGTKFGIKVSRSALESRLVCKESHLLIYLGSKK